MSKDLFLFLFGKGSLLDEQWCIAACPDSVQARLASLPAHAFGRLQSQTQEELDALLPSVLDRAFKGEL